MEDKQLLELAAQAAGIDGRFMEWGPPEHLPGCGFVSKLGNWPWNPLADDGDALRLAVALRIEIRKYSTVWEVVRYGISSAHRVLDVKPPSEDSTEAACFAHRRAVVRAAAMMATAPAA